MTDAGKQDEKLRRCPSCDQETLMLHAKARTWICRNCGYQEPLPDPSSHDEKGQERN